MTLRKLANFIVKDFNLWEDESSVPFQREVERQIERLRATIQPFYKDYEVLVRITGE